MYVKRILVENIRGFRELDFSLQRPDGSYAGWTVFTGDNASGKSSLLKATAIALAGLDAAHSLQASFAGWVRSAEQRGTVALELVQTADDDSFREGGRTAAGPFWAELSIANRGKEPTLERSRKYTGKRKTATRGPWAAQPAGWFSCGYGPFRRTAGTSPDAQRLMVGPSRIARFVTLFREDASLAECEKWLKELRFRAIEGREDDGQKLQLVQGMLNDELLQNGLRVERIDSDGLWLRDQSDTVLPMADMSDGYRAVLALMTDILRHLIDTYGLEGLTDEQNGRAVVRRSGVVLIDEIDVHLHPEWQRRIGFWLRDHLPKMQFLVASHSPLICQSADPNGLFHLPEPGSDQPPHPISEQDCRRIRAAKPDTILLSPAFNLKHTRSPLAVRKRQRYADLAAKEAGPGLSGNEQREKQELFAFMQDLEP